jgi:hypothetical protein
VQAVARGNGEVCLSYKNNKETMMAEKTSLGQRWDKYNPSKTLFFWACAFCVAGTMVVGFSWGGWVTGGTAAGMAKNAGDTARAEIAAASCADRFGAGPDAVAQLAALKNAAAYQRGDMLRKSGWATMPGSKDPVDGAADICARALTTAAVPTAIKG